jgi:hypothetical protein
MKFTFESSQTWVGTIVRNCEKQKYLEVSVDHNPFSTLADLPSSRKLIFVNIVTCSCTRILWLLFHNKMLLGLRIRPEGLKWLVALVPNRYAIFRSWFGELHRAQWRMTSVYTLFRFIMTQHDRLIHESRCAAEMDVPSAGTTEPWKCW